MRGSSFVLTALACALASGLQGAQAPDSCSAPAIGAGQETTRVTAGPQYRASGFRRFLLGREYRTLWTTPLQVPVLDLDSFGGGLSPVEKGGGKQTLSLEFKGGDGREYKFRSVDKDPSAVLPRILRDTFADRVVEDQISSAFPAGELVVGPLLMAAGILHVEPRLVVLPDHPLLGDFRGEFAGMLGTLAEAPSAEPVSPGFEGVSKVVSSEKLGKLLEESSEHRIDGRAFLKARLMDILLGDWDRHPKQWNWARSRADQLYQPVPKDRDQAFARFDGVMLALARLSDPRLVNFSPDYPGMRGMMWNSRDLDRRLLSGLERPQWDEVVAELQEKLTDEVIEAAVCGLPAEYRPLEGPRLAAVLAARRDRLPRAAADFYNLLAREVDVFATGADDLALIERQEKGEVELRLIALGEDGQRRSPPYFRRRFRPSETHEVRVYLQGGNDRAISRGDAERRITVRVMGGDGNDSLDDSKGGGSRFYDEQEQSHVLSGPGTSKDLRPYAAPGRPEDGRPLDWGRSTVPLPYLSFDPELGLVVGGGVQLTDFGFRKHPYASRHTVRAGYSTGVASYRADYTGDFRRPNSNAHGLLRLRASGLEVVRFYGFGNEEPSTGPDDFYRVEQQQYSIAPSFVLEASRFSLSLGPLAKFATTRLPPGQFISLARPYGSDDFGQVGAEMIMRLDLRDQAGAPRRGLLFTAGASVFPAVWSVKSTFGEVRAEAGSHLPLPLPLDPTLAVRVGAERVFGAYPFHEAAFLGGPATLRGLERNRYAGDASVYANGELRVPLGRLPFLFSGELGLFALGDVGRVYLQGETSDRWHTGVGGGCWLGFQNGKSTVSFSVARSEGRTGFYLQGGLLF